LKLKTEKEIALEIAKRVRAVRVSRRFTQAELSQRAGVSLGSYRRFEQSGRIEFVSLIRIAQTLGIEDDFEALFEQPPLQSLDEVERMASTKTRKQRVVKRS
jgi:transcriptional regulator with XRE-family HTH domain